MIIMSLCLLLSCNKKQFDSEAELMDYIKNQDNGYLQNKSVNGIKFALMYRPIDLMVNQDLNDSMETNEIKRLRDIYERYLYFSLSISKNNKELLSMIPNNQEEFASMANELSFQFSEKVSLSTQRRDTIELADYVYPRMFGMANATTFMFIYPRDKTVLESEYLNFSIRDFGLLTGEINFKVNTDIIKNEPQLSYLK